MSKPIPPFLPLACLFALAAFPLRGDVVETKDGSRIAGKLTKIDGGKVYLKPSFSDEIAIKQDEVVSISTDHPVSVRMESGTRVDGTISSPNGVLQIAGAEGTISTSVPKIAASWPAGELDPAIVKLQRHWKYDATVDINGTTGNKSQLGTSLGFAAKLVAPRDELGLYTAYNRQVTEGVKSADQFKAGIDYASRFSERMSWFLRDEAGFDRVMGIRFYDTAAVGIGRDFIKNDVDVLTGRVGVAYRYAGYVNPLAPTVSSMAADFEINHDLKTANWELVDKITFVPAFSNFSNYIATQDSYFQIPLKSPAWKLRLGLANNLNNRPPPGIKKIDTIYYTRLVLNWGD